MKLTGVEQSFSINPKKEDISDDLKHNNYEKYHLECYWIINDSKVASNYRPLDMSINGHRLQQTEEQRMAGKENKI